MKNWQVNGMAFALAFMSGVAVWFGTNDGLSQGLIEEVEVLSLGSSGREMPNLSLRQTGQGRVQPDQLAARQTLLNQLFEKNPRVIDGFSVELFDQDLLVDQEEGLFWGLSEDDAKLLSSGMKELFSDIWSEEIKNYSTEQLDNGKLVVFVRALNRDDVISMRSKIGVLFRQYFLPSLADCLVEKVIAQQRSVFAGLSGLNRIIEITPTSEETFGLSGRGSNIRVTYLDAKMSNGEEFDANAEYPRGLKARTDEIVENPPLIYSHFFEEVK